MDILHQFVTGWLLTPTGLLAFLFYITLVVFIHEMGHFLVARWFGAKVDVFSVGFGREIVGFTDRRGTRWKLSWLPIGGYVKFAGDADAASTPDPDAQAAPAKDRELMMQFKPLHQRALVAAAGPFANFILAILLFFGLFLYSGHTTRAPLIGEVVKASAAEAAGIRAGDTVARIDGRAIDGFDRLQEIIATSGRRAWWCGRTSWATRCRPRPWAWFRRPTRLWSPSITIHCRHLARRAAAPGTLSASP
jgi:regulator of sigma E protease